MKKILITGASGQLGSEIRRNLPQMPKNHYLFTDKEALDITNYAQLKAHLVSNPVDFIVNCAAYTSVDKAESEYETAQVLNALSVGYLAEISKEIGAKIIHISTDYVFSGDKNTPYTEADPTNPITNYGKTKREGELRLQQASIPYIIIRTSWLYSSFGNNFVKTIAQLASERTQLKVVYDQIGTPTYAAHLAKFIVEMLETNQFDSTIGIYHFSNEGVCSWYDLATEVALFTNSSCAIIPCLSEEYKTLAKRPNYSVLDKSKLKTTFNYGIPHWRTALNQCMLLLK